VFRDFARPALAHLRNTHELIAVTAEPEYMARAVATTLDLHRIISSCYQAHDGIFTGEVAISLTHRDQKRLLIGDIHPQFAFGDSAGDIEMLSHAQKACCIAPDDELRSRAQAAGWLIFDGEHDTDKIIAAVTDQ
jgi:phosphoserine phosphatase